MILSQSYEFAPATIKAYVLYTRNEIELKTVRTLFSIQSGKMYFYISMKCHGMILLDFTNDIMFLRMNVFVLPVYFEYTPRFWNPISFFIYYWMESLIDVEFTCVFHT